MAGKNKNKGLTLINTGNGKGKTTAALGLALRAAGHDMRVCVIQFIKGNRRTGEARALEKFKDQIDFHVMGSGFTWQAENIAEVIRQGREAFRFAGEMIAVGKYDMIILDELTYLVKYDMISENAVVEMINNRPPGLHLVITGRDAGEEMIAAADLVTEMREVKHHYAEGVKACPGIEF